jgi:pimeloyl-ACP methyl ester carboxylesterase
VLIGHSMGGRNAAFCAQSRPDRVRALVLADYSPENAPTGSKRVAESVGNQPDAFESVDAAMRYFGIDPASAAGAGKRKRYEAYLRPVPGGFALKRDLFFRDQFRRVLETGERPRLGVDMWQVLAAVKCPLLVVRGRDSDMFAAETLGRVRAANPAARIEEIDAGHDVAGDNPDAFLAAVQPFLSALEQEHDQPA